jgi:hypothetical protein
MTAVQREYLLKGVFLGAWAFFALGRPTDAALGRAVGLTAAGLLVGLVAGAIRLLMVGYRPAANPGGFLLLTLLDNPLWVYLGVVGGATAGVLLGTEPPREWLLPCAGGGAVLGLGLHQLGQVRSPRWRLGLGAVVGAGLTALALGYLNDLPAFQSLDGQRAFALALLAGLPAFYVLMFGGDADESEVEAAALCGTLAVGLYLARLSTRLPEQYDKLILLAPLLIYYLYATRYQPRLRVFKHVLRGYGSLSVGRTRDALVGFGRALRLNPRSEAAAAGLRRLHRSLDPAALPPDALPLLNFGLMLDRAEELLVRDRPPTAAERAEADRLLDLADAHRPELAPRADYLRAISLTHAGDFDAAAAALSKLLDPATEYADRRHREPVLLPAWDLATRLHPQLVARLGEAEAAKPGRRLDALGAVERRLAVQADDQVAVGLRRELYAGLTEAEVAAGPVPPGFNFDHLEQLGLALVSEGDPARADRGMAYLRMAGRGLPARGPGLFRTLADLATKLGRPDEAAGYLGQVKRTGLEAGVKALPPDQRAAYVAAVKQLADLAESRGDFAAAVDDYRLFVEAGGEDVAKLRHLADLYGKAGDALNGLAITERGLLYAKADPELLAMKDSFYYSVDPDRVRGVRDKVAPWFDVAYCVRKATAVAAQKDADLDTLGYGLHLARLARVLQPGSNAVRFAEGRLLLRTGERDAGVSLLEDVRESKRGSGDDEDAWFLASRLLADLYLDELSRPDLAVQCLKDFREYQKSGADTLYRLGQAYEAADEPKAAVQAYKAVTAYSGHPRYWDADAAVRRLTTPPT